TAAGLQSNVGTTIAGTGVIQGNSVILGNLKPGDEAGSTMGTLVVNGALQLGSTSATTFQVQRPSYTNASSVDYNDATNYGAWISGIATDATYSHLLNDTVTTAQHDQLLVMGGLTIDAGGKIVLTNMGYTPTAGDVFNLIDWVGALTGSFNVGGTSYNGGLLRTGAETGTDLDLFELGSDYRWDVSQFNTQGILVVVTPEPGRMVLLLFGLLGLCVRRRRRQTV
ncbi:MAG: PEP-CTERM sorting domain-containing protein, partial [Verrucomicrobiales bacterium]|nr:PEP-CTERM sorting domain-containing protein [Verrucomicrobiales bacterium]